jgi:hypothetical protein
VAVDLVLALPGARPAVLAEWPALADLPALRRGHPDATRIGAPMSGDCPAGIDWCAGGHRCQPLLREHRSDPWPIPGPYGTLVATRVRSAGRDRVELRALVDLPSDAQQAEDMARLLAVGTDLTIRAIRVGELAPIRVAYRRLYNVRVR